MNTIDKEKLWTREEIYLHFMIDAPKQDFDLSSLLYRIKGKYIESLDKYKLE